MRSRYRHSRQARILRHTRTSQSDRVGVSGRRLLEPAKAASLFETHLAKPWRTVNNRPFMPLLGSTSGGNRPVRRASPVSRLESSLAGPTCDRPYKPSRLSSLRSLGRTGRCPQLGPVQLSSVYSSPFRARGFLRSCGPEKRCYANSAGRHARLGSELATIDSGSTSFAPTPVFRMASSRCGAGNPCCMNSSR